jgi:2-polyprenyl-6-methoxyphenol hydroxylase-like FAD-dependent oxidoreductase
MAQTQEDLSVRAIIIGGGIGGFIAAIALRRKGTEAQVYEQSPGRARRTGNFFAPFLVYPSSTSGFLFPQNGCPCN